MDGASPLPPPPDARLTRMLGLLEHDPDNVRLLADVAGLAFDAGAFDTARALIARHEALADLPPALINARGVIALASGDHRAAARDFTTLLATNDDAALRFNLAWARAMMGDFRGALDLLDDAVVAVSTRAPALKIRMMHHLELYDEALACGRELIDRFPDDQELAGALSVLALDAEENDLAAAYAERSVDRSDEAATTLGTLRLADDRIDEALSLFDRALIASPRNPRAWLGKGLGLLSDGNAVEAVAALDRGAELFGDHVGSWIAAGWAHFVQGRYAEARARFDRALALDESFSESHGSLAVLDVIGGDLAGARRRSDIALRLDRACLSAALAKSLLLEHAGSNEAAEAVRARALAVPLGTGGRTIAQALTSLGLSGGTGKGRTQRP